MRIRAENFPSFLEGLSLRRENHRDVAVVAHRFPFLLGGAFIEADEIAARLGLTRSEFPFLLGGAFIEAPRGGTSQSCRRISLPSWRGFH